MNAGYAAEISLLIPIVAIIGVFAAAITRVIMKSRLRELELRQRIAMIERGLVPPPERDPAAFERAIRVAESRDEYRGAGSYRRMGILIMGVGLGLMLLISLTQSPRRGVGIGGFLLLVGVAFLVNSLFDHGSSATPSSLPPSGLPPSTPPGAPANRD